jgi:UDP-N-acetylglucosamine 2-epimerase (hydrolysing)
LIAIHNSAGLMSNSLKKILFISGTRADFGKLKPLMQAVSDHPDFEYQVFGTGMHMLSKYGNTINEIRRAGFDRVFMFINQIEGDSMELILANTITGLTKFLHENHVDLIVIHGDRVEALAGAIVGALRNILVAHVEGGEVSGTIDDLMRHATSKLSHIHFVANTTAEKRLQQLGESESSIFHIGSPDVDIMLSDKLPSLDDAKKRYNVSFNSFSIAMLHPVTTEVDLQFKHASVFAEAMLESNQNYIVIYPNNDLGSHEIFSAYKLLNDNPRVRIFPSLRFEHFLTFLKHADFIIGNSSAGIHEAPIYGVPTINLGTRQLNRFQYESIFNAEFDKRAILENINRVLKTKRFTPCDHYGDGTSAQKFMSVLTSEAMWQISQQKKFRDLQLN